MYSGKADLFKLTSPKRAGEITRLRLPLIQLAFNLENPSGGELNEFIILFRAFSHPPCSQLARNVRKRTSKYIRRVKLAVRPHFIF